jgi:hypothetical protein
MSDVTHTIHAIVYGSRPLTDDECREIGDVLDDCQPAIEAVLPFGFTIEWDWPKS